MIWLGLLFIAIVLFLANTLLRQFSRPNNYPPGPPWLPIVGNTPLLKKLSKLFGGQHRAFAYLASEYKTNVLGLKLGFDNVVVAISKDAVQEVLLKDIFQDRPSNFFVEVRSMFTNKGVTMTNGQLWYEQRTFAVRHLRQLGLGKSVMEELIIQELKDSLVTIELERENSEILSNLNLFVLNVLWTLVAGDRFSHEDPNLKRLLKVFNERRKAFDMAGGFLSSMPWLRFIAPEKTGYNLMCKINKELGDILRETIKHHKETLNEKKSDDFIYAFLEEMEAQKGAPSTFTDDQLIMMCMDFFIAGAETTSNTLAFALLNMVLNPVIQDKVQCEIKNVLGSRKLPSLGDRIRLPYVEAVLLESQRYIHVVPVAGPRVAPSDTTIQDYFIPKGTMILTNIYSVLYDTDRFKEPDVFRPERFIDEHGHFNLEEPLLQFGLGKRRCLGEALARNFLFLFFTGILRNYSLKSVPGLKPPSLNPIPGISLAPQPCKIQLVPFN